MNRTHKRIIVSGGGTGGHIFPALSIADAWMEKYPDTEMLFVGAQGKIEMERVPQAGYDIIGLPVAGLQRKVTLKNLSFFTKLWKSLRLARNIIVDFEPDAVVGVGGYASFPVLWAASKKGVPILLQEQNSYAGISNKLLGKKASKICVAYENMDRYFPAEKLVLTGNPVRSNMLHLEGKREEAARYFGLDPEKKTIVVVGGSLGARTLNESVVQHLDQLRDASCNVLWQTGKLYHEQLMQTFEQGDKQQLWQNCKPVPFIERMDLAFSLADVIVSRAGAGTISELCMVGKAVILVPSPNVAEDHQTKNALALVEKDAATMVSDVEAREKLVDEMLKLMQDEQRRAHLGMQIKKMEKPQAANEIVQELEKIITQG